MRFSRQLLDTLQDREAITADIVRFAELNGFTRATRTSPWHRARLLNEDEAADAYALVITLRSSLLSLREAMNAMNASLHLRRARTIADWDAQLAILIRIRETLKTLPGRGVRPPGDRPDCGHRIRLMATGKPYRHEQYAAFAPASSGKRVYFAGSAY